MEDFERFFTKLWLRKQRSSDFLIKNNKQYFLVKFYDILVKKLV